MIFLVSKNRGLFDSENYKILEIEEALAKDIIGIAFNLILKLVEEMLIFVIYYVINLVMMLQMKEL